MAGPRAPEPADVLTVSALNARIRGSLEGAFPDVWVAAEISRISRPTSGHLYVTLKDDRSCLSSVVYRGVGFRLKFDLKEGMQVLVRGRLSVYEARGEYQLNIEEIIPKGIGPLELAFQQLKDKLQAKGYFEKRRKKPLPKFARSIALVTSPTGAAIRDMLELLARRWPQAAVLVVPVRVQGEGSAEEIAVAIAKLNRLHAAGAVSVQTIIVGRGGGSLEDLWAFNEEVVADAIFASVIPVISAVGHEIDVTISDLVADHRALTPSHAITDLTPDHGELLAGLKELECRLRERVGRRIEMARQRVGGLADRRVLRSPLDRIRELERRLDDHDGRLQRAVDTSIDRARSRLAAFAGKLESLSPLNVLSRGYSLTRTPDGHVVQEADAVQVGDLLKTRLASGEVISRVEAVTQETSP